MTKEVSAKTVRTPASTANLGPGFDTLAIALDRFIEVDVEVSSSFEVTSSGYGAGVPVDDNHLALQVCKFVLGHSNVALSIRSDIPLARGMGSSAALAVAVAVACESDDPLSVAVHFEGHPENAAASLYGGAVAAASVEGRSVVRGIEVDSELVSVLVIPENELPTHKLRAALPKSVLRIDAIENLSNSLMLALSLKDASTIERFMFKDNIHQRYRSQFFTESDTIMDELIRSGCIGAAWSGAGSTMIGFSTRSHAKQVLSKVKRFQEDRGVFHQVEVVEFNRTGTVVQLA
ncbi:MAG: hypothetical protein HKL81_06265 [Acidimicrobiaceae bacterium]|nr:hypothetical protein [Acidimicrobiaceae bacterium]